LHADRLAAQAGGAATRYGPLFAFVLLLVAYHITFSQFFPNRNGRIGHDYSLALPALLAGYYWFQANGLWEVPWFTPAFCGGQPFFADPQYGYYSVLQLLTLAIEPLQSAYLTMLLFAALGYWGCYLLLRRCFVVGRQAAVLAAAIFMFNGFFAHRMIIGHLGYHGFMLIPWMAYFLAVPAPAAGPRWLMTSAAACIAGVVGAYWIQSGLGALVIPSGLALVLILLAYGTWVAQPSAGRIVYRSLVGALVTAALSAAKVVAGASFLANFPRAEYLLPGYQSIGAALKIAVLSLFVSPPDIDEYSQAVLENVQWAGGRPELEYGVTMVPLLILAVGAGIGIWRLAAGKAMPAVNPSRVILLAVTGMILFLPILLNTYAPDWNALLKQMPIIKSSSTLVRWFIIYVPLLALLSALAFERSMGAIRTSAAIIAIALVVAINLMQDRRSYTQEPYDPEPAVQAYREARGGAPAPSIRRIGVYRDADGTIVQPIHRNDGLSQGYSSLYCYNPVFGYRLENFPFKDLHPGPVREARDGHFNIKNPACYVYPKENECRPGDHFRETEREDMEKFVSYRPFTFNMSATQKAANALTLFGLVASVILVLAAGAFVLVELLSGARRSPAGPGPI